MVFPLNFKLEIVVSGNVGDGKEVFKSGDTENPAELTPAGFLNRVSFKDFDPVSQSFCCWVT